MNLIFIKDFNNYFDRIVKNHNYINDYIDNREYQIIENVNFEEKNRIDSSHIVNWKNDWVPNYMLAVEGDTILSKWFVLEWDKIRGRQFKAILKGDVIAMNLKQIQDSPIFVEKGILPISNPLLFNTENGSYNQIKQKETLLKDNTNIGWLVGYYAQDDKNEGKDREIIGEFSSIEGSDPIEDISTIKKGVYLNFGNENKETFTQNAFRIIVGINTYGGQGTTTKRYFYNTTILEKYISTVNDPNQDRKGKLFTIHPANYNRDKIRNKLDEALRDNGNTLINLCKDKFFDSSNFLFHQSEYIKSLNNKVVQKDGKYYQIKVSVLNEYKTIELNEPRDKVVDGYRELIDPYFYEPDYGASSAPYLTLQYISNRYVVKCVPFDESVERVKVNISSKRNHLNDAPYDMFVAPYDLRETITNYCEVSATEKFEINNILTLATIRSLLEQLGGSGTNKFIYDIQYLPYCPIKELRDNYYDNTFHLKEDPDGFKKGFDYDLIYRLGPDGNVLSKAIGFIAWGTKSSGTLNIPVDIKVSDNNIERKVENETKLVRLVSPNYNGIFEFSPAKNNGVHYINVDYTYKPYAPYLHMNPDFSGLYGKDFNDDRGLIVGGDFSIPAISDNFINYALNNKNYQEIFNREIKHMDFTHNLNIEQQQIANGINSVTGLIGGATAGFMSGAGVGGAIAGGLIGGVGTAVSGAMDIKYANIQHRENKAYQTDMYTFNLGNIKAQPQSLSKTTPFTFNNKIFPFIEEYDATEEEKQSLRLKLKYNGMNIFKVDTLSNYIHEDDKLYFKGQLIRVNDLGDDYNMACAIYSELDKGVYM